MSGKLKIIYLISFLLSISYAFTAYINSTYLENFIPSKFVGLLFSLGALLAIIGLSKIPKFLSRKGNFKVSLYLSLLLLASLVGLSVTNSPILVIIFFLAFFTLEYLLVFTRDVFVESFSDARSTGKVRGALLTIINLGWVFAPLVSALVLENFGYRSIYVLAFVFSLPVVFLLKSSFSNFKDVIYEKMPFWNTLKKIMADKDIRDIYLANFLLQFFSIEPCKRLF